jgi:hypothetical protein
MVESSENPQAFYSHFDVLPLFWLSVVSALYGLKNSDTRIQVSVFHLHHFLPGVRHRRAALADSREGTTPTEEPNSLCRIQILPTHS